MNTKNNIGIHFLGLTPKETAIFERVVSFNVTHGLEVSIENDIQNAKLIIVSSESFNASQFNNNQNTYAVIVDDESNALGDLQILRPLMITKVMSSLTEAVELCKSKQNDLVDNTSEELIDINIEDASIDVATETNHELVSNQDSNTHQQTVSGSVANTENPLTSTNVTNDSDESISSHHALIIDDSAAIRKQLELELRDAGISSDFAECGEDALEKIQNNHFDLVFLDIIMPGIDGYETCKGIRSNAAFKKTPIIMLSGKTSPLDEVQGVIAGATTYLTKPVKSDKLQETLNRVTKWLENYAPSKQKESV